MKYEHPEKTHKHTHSVHTARRMYTLHIHTPPIVETPSRAWRHQHFVEYRIWGLKGSQLRGCWKDGMWLEDVGQRINVLPKCHHRVGVRISTFKWDLGQENKFDPCMKITSGIRFKVPQAHSTLWRDSGQLNFQGTYLLEVFFNFENNW